MWTCFILGFIFLLIYFPLALVFFVVGGIIGCCRAAARENARRY
jgi:hypothetical protein